MLEAVFKGKVLCQMSFVCSKELFRGSVDVGDRVSRRVASMAAMDMSL